MSNLFQRAIAIAFAAAALAANAGGPLSLCSAGTPVKYAGAGTVTMNYDLGTLGSRTNAQAAAIVNAALATWTNVGTATITMTRGANLPVDVTTANYLTYLGNSTFGDGLNPVVYDTDGSLTDLMLGPGASNNVLGFAGSAYNLSPCQYVEGRAVINGKIAVSDATMTTVLTHELGHFIGLDHTQLDGAQGLPTSNYPLMYPVAYRTNAGLHEDDIAAISALYPDTTVNATYGTLTGTFVTSGGTPVLGANIWAQNTTTGKVFSVVSDYLQQGTGYFKLLLTPGSYTLHAEAIDTSFTGGSGVGPYSNDLTDTSFQAPLYSGTTPMAAVTLGTPLTIVAGCNATATFRINGTGTVGGNCSTLVATTTALVSSANPSFGQAVTFTATVTPSSGTPTGTVLFQANGLTIAGCSAVALTGALTAACTTSALTLGASSIVASYSGSATHAASASATLGQTVTAPSVVIMTGSPQSTLIGSAFATPLQVRIQDPNGNPLGNVVVTFVAPAPGQGVATAALSTTTVTTDALGLATISATANAQEGIYSVQASAPGSSMAAFTLTNLISLDRFQDPLLFVMQQYRDFLNREGDASGVNFWASRINGGASTRGQTVESFFNSAEFQATTAPVVRLYFAYFNRIPDYPGLSFWIDYVKAGHSIDEISNFFAGSAEFTSTYGSLTNAQYVNLVYQNVLGRAADSGGFSFWLNQLNSGAMSRGQVMRNFSESAEYQSISFRKVYVTMMYSGMLRRAPDPGGFDYWVGYMATNSGLALINGFLASAEYHNRFLP